ncbi:MAG: GGDEF domain-containing protein [Rhodanobacteraceae bacterium]|nr:GGDEF domain-containing protein [Rhodanobacteraceae bacterium]
MTKGDALIANAAASGADAALMVVDIDRFKQVNDRHGHAVGDRAIQHVARQLLQSCAGFGSAGRLGGEEFIGLLANVGGPTQALQIAEQLRQAVEESPLQIEGAAEPLPLTVSIGVASRQSQDRDFTAWLQRADQALYAAKAAGRNRVASAG